MSKKLQDNGLWESSRMMLPEHREALLDRRKSPAPGDRPNVPTPEELGWIRNSVLLPILLSVIENQYEQLRLAPGPLKKLYMTAALLLMRLVRDDWTELKKRLRQRNIKVFEEEKGDAFVRCRFICRGYEDRFAMPRDVVRAEIGMKLSEYTDALFRKLQQNRQGTEG